MMAERTLAPRPIDPNLTSHHALHTRLERGFRGEKGLAPQDFYLLLQEDPVVAWRASIAVGSKTSGALATMLTELLLSQWRMDKPVSLVEVVLADYLLPLHAPPTIAQLAFILSRARVEFFYDLRSGSRGHVYEEALAESRLSFITNGEVRNLSRDDIEGAVSDGAYMPHVHVDFRNRDDKVFPRSYVWMMWNTAVADSIASVIDQRFGDGSGLFWAWMSKRCYPSWRDAMFDATGERRRRSEVVASVAERVALLRGVDLYSAMTYMYRGVNDPAIIKGAVENKIDVDTALALGRSI